MEKSKNKPDKTENVKKKYRMVTARPLQSIGVINRVVMVLYNYKRSVSYKDIAVACNMHPVNVSQALSAAHDIGLTALAGAKGLYTLTEDGIEYVRLLTSGKEKDASKLLRDILMKNKRWTEIMTFLNATRGQARDPIDLVLEIERNAGKQWKPTMRGRLRDSLVSILEFAEVIVREGSKIIAIGERQTVQLEEESQYPPSMAVSPDREFAMLKGDDFTFEIRKDLKALEFAEKQFLDWIKYLRTKLQEK